METFPRLEPWYVSGLLEATAAFTFSRSGRRHVNLYMTVKRPASDRPLLAELQGFFGGIGRLYGPPTVGRASPPTPTTCQYRVTRLDELPRIAEHLEAFPLRGTKRHAFALWREMLALKAAAYRRAPPARLDELCQLLSETLRRRSGFTHP